MDGPISTSEVAGPAQQAASVPLRSPAVGTPEKVPPVLEGNRSRSSVRDETGLPGKVNRNPAGRDRKAGAGGPAETQAPPYFLELRPGGGGGFGQKPTDRFVGRCSRESPRVRCGHGPGSPPPSRGLFDSPSTHVSCRGLGRRQGALGRGERGGPRGEHSARAASCGEGPGPNSALREGFHGRGDGEWPPAPVDDTIREPRDVPIEPASDPAGHRPLRLTETSSRG